MNLEQFGDKTALIYSGKDGSVKSFSYAELDYMSEKAAKIILSKGIKPGDRVFVYMERIPELYFFVLGILKCGAIYCPLFSSFGPDAIMDRIKDAGGSLVITQGHLADNIPDMEIIDASVIWKSEISGIENTYIPCDTDMAILHYTSGTTGKPKGAMHWRKALKMHERTAREVLGITEDDIYWCTADPAWVTGSSYGVFGPLQCGTTILVCDPGYKLDAVFKTIQDFKISIWYTSPTLLRMIIREDSTKIKKYDLSSLKRIYSVGEALNPEIIKWSQDNIGLPIYDTWFQTETGAIMICNRKGIEIKPGSMGKPIEGIEACILDENYDISICDTIGHLALKPGWDSMMQGFWGRQHVYSDCFKNDWYITGDLAKVDSDGYFWFASREDDVINTAGHLISPFEIESVLMEHPSVAEAAALSVPDKIMGEVVKVVIVLKDGFTASNELKLELRLLVRNRIANYATPQILEFMQALPKTRSGKIIRRLLK